MLKTLAFLLLAALAALPADTWEKVRELDSGVELRVFKKGGRQPLLAIMDQASGDKLIVVMKNEQVAISKDDIERLDYRPRKPGSRRISTQTTNKVEDPNGRPPAARPQGAQVPGTSTTSTLSVGSKPDFETIYRQTASPAAPAKLNP